MAHRLTQRIIGEVEFYKIANKLVAEEQPAGRGPEPSSGADGSASSKLEGEPDAGIMTPCKEAEKGAYIGQGQESFEQNQLLSKSAASPGEAASTFLR